MSNGGIIDIDYRKRVVTCQSVSNKSTKQKAEAVSCLNRSWYEGVWFCLSERTVVDLLIEWIEMWIQVIREEYTVDYIFNILSLKLTRLLSYNKVNVSFDFAWYLWMYDQN